MRGKLYRPAQAVSGARITHAGARKTVSVYPSAARASDHPRGCGENLNTVRRLTPAFGSPPRMRGKRICHAVGIICTRITPADAGKTELQTSLLRQSADHPRGCGENAAASFMPFQSPGSPPRMPGKLIGALPDIIAARITPADAGKTPFAFCT